MKSAAASGRLKAGQAANGVDVNSGSAVAVQSGQRKAGLLDTATVANNAELQAYGYRSQAAGFNAQAGLERCRRSKRRSAPSCRLPEAC